MAGNFDGIKKQRFGIEIELNAEEFKNVRKHLLSHLEGNIAWKNPEDAIAQREKLKQERIAAREQAVAAVSRETEEVEIVSAEGTEALYGDSEEELDEEEISFGIMDFISESRRVI